MVAAETTSARNIMTRKDDVGLQGLSSFGPRPIAREYPFKSIMAKILASLFVPRFTAQGLSLQQVAASKSIENGALP